MADKQHYHLAATRVLFMDNTDQKVSEMHYNVMLATESQNVRVHDLGVIQQQAQMLFFKGMDPEAFTVVDVFILSVSYLGHMTQEFFTYRPPVSEEAKEAVKSALASGGTKTDAALNV